MGNVSKMVWPALMEPLMVSVEHWANAGALAPARMQVSTAVTTSRFMLPSVPWAVGSSVRRIRAPCRNRNPLDGGQGPAERKDSGPRRGAGPWPPGMEATRVAAALEGLPRTLPEHAPVAPGEVAELEEPPAHRRLRDRPLRAATEKLPPHRVHLLWLPWNPAGSSIIAPQSGQITRNVASGLVSWRAGPVDSASSSGELGAVGADLLPHRASENNEPR